MTVHRLDITTGFPPRGAIISAPSFSLLNWYAWTPGRETRAAWCEWAGGALSAHEAVPPRALPMMMRRRLSSFGQRLVNALVICGEGTPEARFVLSTRHGELSRALNILKDIEANTLPSPTDFSMAIHHALLGLLSIHADNRMGHTALSAGWDSFASGMLEAVMCVTERPDQPVVFVYADEPLPTEYDAFRESDDASLPLIVALTIGRPSGAPEEGFSLELVPHATGRAPSAGIATDFLRFFLSKASSVHGVGRHSDWVWRRVSS